MRTKIIAHVLEIGAAPAKVFEMWTTADGVRVCAGDPEGDARPGGALRVDSEEAS